MNRFVRKLRKQSQWNRTRQVVTQNSVLVTREEQTIVEQPANGEDTIAMSPIRTAPTARIADGKDVSFGTVPIPTLPFAHTAEPSMDQLAIRTKLKSVAEQSADEAALSRLAYDLSLSLPLILTMVSVPTHCTATLLTSGPVCPVSCNQLCRLSGAQDILVCH